MKFYLKKIKKKSFLYMQCMPALLLKLQNLTEYVDLFSLGIGIFIILFIQDLPYPDICDISFKKV